MISETDQNGNRISDNVYLNGKLIARIGPAGEVGFYHTDPAGTPLAMTDTSGNVLWRADYRPFGEEQIITETVSNNYQFVGKEKDEETGLYYFGARYMESKIGRFISPDPVDPGTGRKNEKILRNPQKINLYAYGLNNPYRYIDPDGNAVWDIADFAFFGYDAYKFAKDPSWSNAVDLALDAVGLLPLIPSVGMIKAAGKGIDKTIEASRAAKESEEIIKGGLRFTKKQAQAFERQLAQHGRESLERSISTFESRLAEHHKKLEEIKKVGGHTSSVEREIRNYKQQISAAKDVLRRQP